MKKLLISVMILSLVLGVVGCEESKYIDNTRPQILETSKSMVRLLEQNIDNKIYMTYEQMAIFQDFYDTSHKINLNEHEKELIQNLANSVLLASEIKLLNDKNEDVSVLLDKHNKEIEKLKKNLNIK